MGQRSFTFIGFLLFLNILTLKGQLSVTVGYRRATEAINIEVPITVADPSFVGFSTAEFSKQFPDSKIISEDIKVNYPDMTGSIDTIGILWYLKPEKYSPRGEVNIIVIGIKPDSSKTYYIDNNNDRTFNDDEDKFVFKPEDEKRIIEIKIIGVYGSYTLLNPDFVKPVNAPSRAREFYEAWRSSSKRPSLGADFSFMGGAGSAALSFDPMSGIVHTYKYQANITGCIRPGIGLDLSWYNVHILFSGSFERLQYDETVRFGYNDNVPKPQRNYNSGLWNTKKLHAGMSVEYDLGLFRRLWITPLWSYYFFSNSDNLVFDIYFNPPPDAEYTDMHSIEYGLKIKLPTSPRTFVYIKASYIESWFDASEFLPPYDPASYSLDYHQTFFGLGVQYRLTKNKNQSKK